MNFLPASAAFAVCAAVGLWKSSQLKKRAHLLSELSQMVADISLGIRYTAPTLDELSEGFTGVFGALLREARQSEPDIKAAWEAASAGLSALPYAERSEAELMSGLGRELGTCDAEGQLAILSMYAEKLKRLSAEAEQNAKVRGKLFRSVGTLLGAGVAILIL